MGEEAKWEKQLKKYSNNQIQAWQQEIVAKRRMAEREWKTKNNTAFTHTTGAIIILMTKLYKTKGQHE